MKAVFLALVPLLAANFANAETGEICGTLNPSEGCLSEDDNGKPQGVCLVVPATTRFSDAYFLRAKNAEQNRTLASLEQYREYCIQGELSWCGRNQSYRCLTVESVRS